MNTRMIHTNGVDFCVETFGSSDNPAVLLIPGAGASMVTGRPSSVATSRRAVAR